MADVPRIQIKSVKNYYWVRTKLLPLSSTEVFNSLPINATSRITAPHLSIIFIVVIVIIFVVLINLLSVEDPTGLVVGGTLGDPQKSIL